MRRAPPAVAEKKRSFCQATRFLSARHVSTTTLRDVALRAHFEMHAASRAVSGTFASPSRAFHASRAPPPRARFAPRASAGAGDVAGALFSTDKRPIILFDGVCNLCNGGGNLALDLDPPGKLRFAALQSDAVLRIATYLENPALPAAAALGMFFPEQLRDAVYDLVAANRYELLGMKDECRLGDDRFDDRFVADAPNRGE